MMGLGMGVGLVLMLIFWGLLIAGAVWLAKAALVGRDMPRGAPRQAEPKPGEILDLRYARGEISRDEYERISADLGL